MRGPSATALGCCVPAYALGCCGSPNPERSKTVHLPKVFILFSMRFFVRSWLEKLPLGPRGYEKLPLGPTGCALDSQHSPLGPQGPIAGVVEGCPWWQRVSKVVTIQGKRMVRCTASAFHSNFRKPMHKKTDVCTATWPSRRSSPSSLGSPREPREPGAPVKKYPCGEVLGYF